MHGTIGLAILLSPGLFTAPEKPAARQPAPVVGKLVQQLGDADFQKREAAMKLLEALGPAALPDLRKALGHPDAEVRRRLLELIPVLERTAALTPKRVSLHLDNRPMSEAVAACSSSMIRGRCAPHSLQNRLHSAGLQARSGVALRHLPTSTLG